MGAAVLVSVGNILGTTVEGLAVGAWLGGTMHGPQYPNDEWEKVRSVALG